MAAEVIKKCLQLIRITYPNLNTQCLELDSICNKIILMGKPNAHINNECPHVPKLAKFKPPRCPIGVYWNTLCLMRDVWTIKTYMI